MARLLIGDSDARSLEFLRRTLSHVCQSIVAVCDAEAAARELLSRPTDVAIVDLFAPGFHGVRSLSRFMKSQNGPSIVVVTSNATIGQAVAAVKHGAAEFFEKPLDGKRIVTTVERLIESRPIPRYWAPKLRRFVSENLALADLSLRLLSRDLGISESYASKLFRDELGVTFRRHVAQARISRAKKLLASGNAPLYHIASKCGFSNQSRLAETFRRLEGMAPSVYRRIAVDSVVVANDWAG